MNPDGPLPSSAEPGFDVLLGEIAAQLLGAPLEGIDAVIATALSGLVAFLDVERTTIGLIDPADGQMRIAHSAATPGVPPARLGLGDFDFPWLTRRIREERAPIIFSTEMELPREAALDLETARAYGLKSAAIFPIAAGSRFLGCLSFATARVERRWTPPTIDRLRLIAEVFAAAFLRLEHEQKLRASLAELELLREQLQAENEQLRERMFVGDGFDDIVGESAALRSVLFQAEQVAPMDSTVLLLGETGTGKELIAQAIHVRSQRRNRALVKVNCAALPSTLIESELFGHEKGAFTGAISRKIGRFELADRSTLFLDEISELPLPLQAKLLRVLQEGEFERLGSSATHKADVRVIAASNRDLVAAVRAGIFRSDLYYRLGVFPIELPPLRARKTDVPLLVWHFLGQLGTTLGKRIERVPASTMERLVRYAWPGNIRELRNVLERAAILSPTSTLVVEELDGERRVPVVATAAMGGPRTLAELERDHILRVLETCHWRVRGPGNAATQLGLNASTLYSRMKKLGIRRSPVDQPAAPG